MGSECIIPFLHDGGHAGTRDYLDGVNSTPFYAHQSLQKVLYTCEAAVRYHCSKVMVQFGMVHLSKDTI